jgi:transketolase
VKPIDTNTLLAAAAATGDRLVVVEDHYPEGGLGGAVLEALNDAGHPTRVIHLAVQGLPGSGSPQERMEAAGISAGHIADAARQIVGIGDH